MKKTSLLSSILFSLLLIHLMCPSAFCQSQYPQSHNLSARVADATVVQMQKRLLDHPDDINNALSLILHATREMGTQKKNWEKILGNLFLSERTHPAYFNAIIAMFEEPKKVKSFLEQRNLNTRLIINSAFDATILFARTKKNLFYEDSGEPKIDKKEFEESLAYFVEIGLEFIDDEDPLYRSGLTTLLKVIAQSTFLNISNWPYNLENKMEQALFFIAKNDSERVIQESAIVGLGNWRRHPKVVKYLNYLKEILPERSLQAKIDQVLNKRLNKVASRTSPIFLQSA